MLVYNCQLYNDKKLLEVGNMFKFFYKKTLLMVLFLFLAGFFVNEEKAYASELIAVLPTHWQPHFP